MPDISHKDAGFIVLVAVLLCVILIFTVIKYAGNYFDKKEPKTLNDVIDKVSADHQGERYERALNTLLTYLKNVEANPMQHAEFGPVFTLIAKNHLMQKEVLEAFYYATVAEHFYRLFEIAIEPDDTKGVLIGNLRQENAKNLNQAGLLLPPEKQTEIIAKINSQHAGGAMRGTADWIRMRPVSELS